MATRQMAYANTSLPYKIIFLTDGCLWLKFHIHHLTIIVQSVFLILSCNYWSMNRINRSLGIMANTMHFNKTFIVWFLRRQLHYLFNQENAPRLCKVITQKCNKIFFIYISHQSRYYWVWKHVIRKSIFPFLVFLLTILSKVSVLCFVYYLLLSVVFPKCIEQLVLQSERDIVGRFIAVLQF